MELETTRPVAAIPPISRDTDAREVAVAAYERLFAVLAGLEVDAWSAPTECEGWDVAAMVGHLIGAGEACASMREMVRQQVRGRREAARFSGNALDATNALQVRKHEGRSPAERVEALRAIAPAAVRGRMRLPRGLRRVNVSIAPGGSTAAGMPSRLRLGRLMDVVYTRDIWLHTIDIVRATSIPYTPTPEVDGRIVEDVVVEWTARHGQPVALSLTGPAGGRFRAAGGGDELRLDAIAFCRILSGRADRAAAGGAEEVTGSSRAQALLDTRLIF